MDALLWQDHNVTDYLPQDILQRRFNANGEEQLLIKWESKPIEEATWESKDNMVANFPFFNLHTEDNVDFSGGGDVAAQATTQAQAGITPNEAAHTIAKGRPKRSPNRPVRFQV
jgi:hypothetical protein